MEFILHLYPAEWWSYRNFIGGTTGVLTDIPPILPQSEPNLSQLNQWLSLARQCGFTMISIDETLSAWKGDHWDFVYTRLINGKSFIDHIVDAGFAVELRLWAYFPRPNEPPMNSNPPFMTPTLRNAKRTTYSTSVGMNPYAEAAPEAMAWFAQGIKDAGLYDKAKWISIGWTDSGEIDNVRTFSPFNPFKTPKPARGLPPARALSTPSPAEWRTIEHIPAFQNMLDAVIGVFGTEKPIGGQRGSIWHIQYERQDYPFSPLESASYLADANQTPDNYFTDNPSGFTPSSPPNYLQRLGVAFSSDILKTGGLEVMVNEIDGQNLNFARQNPPGYVYKGDWVSGTYALKDTVTREFELSPNNDYTMFFYSGAAANTDTPDRLSDNKWKRFLNPAMHTDALKDEMIERARLCFERGVHVMIIHFEWPVVKAWIDAFQQMACLRNMRPAPTSDPITVKSESVSASVEKWQSTGGSVSESVPVKWIRIPGGG